MRRGQPAGGSFPENQRQPAGHQNNYAVMLSVGFSTGSTRNQAACLLCNTPEGVAAALRWLAREATAKRLT